MASLEDSGETTRYYFTRDLTVLIDVIDNNAVKPEVLIDSIELHCGKDDVVAACVPKSGNAYEVTLKSDECIEILRDGLEVCGKQFECQELVSKFKIVSIMNLSCYVTDDEIHKKFEAIGVEIVSDIKRHCYKGTSVADGTRIMKVKLPQNMVSLPYSMKFNHTEKEYSFYRVVHNDQKKVCSKCFSVDHMYKECPMYTCYACDEQGHVRKECPHPFCSSCKYIKSKCTCEPSSQSGFVFAGNGFNSANKRKINDDLNYGGKRPYGETKHVDPPHDDTLGSSSKNDENEVNMNSDNENEVEIGQENIDNENNVSGALNDTNSTIDCDDEFQDCEYDNKDLDTDKTEKETSDGDVNVNGESDGFSLGESASSTQGDDMSQSRSGGRKSRRKKKKGQSRSSSRVKVDNHDGS